jgi:GrpB-like predicted nucleotidyltransferase (UPF0157 family)
MIGLKKGTVKLSKSQYDEWHFDFENEKLIILNKIGNHITEIHHIGSTSIPGLKAKPIIDMIAVIDKLDDYKKLVKPLEEIGYHFMPDGVFEIRDRVFFPKGPESKRTHHLSLTTKDSPQYGDNLLFRDYLRDNKPIRKDYQELKLKLSKKFANDRKSYTEAKANFIQKTLNSARVSRDSSKLVH